MEIEGKGKRDFIEGGSGVLTLALAKGRLLEPAVTFLRQADIQIPEDIFSSRKLLSPDPTGSYQFLLVKPMDLPTYVEYGVAAVGICGRDVLLETAPDLHQPLDLGIGRCRLVLAGRANSIESNRNLLSNTRVATKFPRVTERYFRAQGIPAEVIYLSGSVELAPGLGLADKVVDLVETGRTLRENGLEVLEEIAKSSARVVVNRAAFHLQHTEIQNLLSQLRKVTT
jgi:ATP phosphoribosyltransferase